MNADTPRLKMWFEQELASLRSEAGEFGGAFPAIAKTLELSGGRSADPHVELRDGTVKRDMTAREVTGEEKALWWGRAIEAFPDYADYQQKTDREIPVFVLTPDPAA